MAALILLFHFDDDEEDYVCGGTRALIEAGRPSQ